MSPHKRPLQNKQLNILVTEALYKEIQTAAQDQDMGLSAFVRACLRQGIARPRQASSFQELPLCGLSDRPLEDTLSWLMARAPLLGDLQSKEGHQLHPKIRMGIRRLLKPLPAERMILYLQGSSFEDQARSEGVSRQAIFICIQKALKRVSADPTFLRLLKEVCAPEKEQEERWYG